MPEKKIKKVTGWEIWHAKKKVICSKAGFTLDGAKNVL
jgi:uncharacterized protein YuzE